MAVGKKKKKTVVFTTTGRKMYSIVWIVAICKSMKCCTKRHTCKVKQAVAHSGSFCRVNNAGIGCTVLKCTCVVFISSMSLNWMLDTFPICHSSSLLNMAWSRRQDMKDKLLSRNNSHREVKSCFKDQLTYGLVYTRVNISIPKNMHRQFVALNIPGHKRHSFSYLL